MTDSREPREIEDEPPPARQPSARGLVIFVAAIVLFVMLLIAAQLTFR
jgi:hypothetical protein